MTGGHNDGIWDYYGAVWVCNSWNTTCISRPATNNRLGAEFLWVKPRALSLLVSPSSPTASAANLVEPLDRFSPRS